MKTCAFCGKEFAAKDEFVTHEIDKDGRRTRFMSIAFISVGSDGKDFLRACPGCTKSALMAMENRINNATSA